MDPFSNKNIYGQKRESKLESFLAGVCMVVTLIAVFYLTSLIFK